MKKIIYLLFIFSTFGFSQQTVMHSVYFNFDKDAIKPEEIKELLQFTKDIDVAKIMSVNIYGYCDDRGNKDYNYKLILTQDKVISYIL